MEKRINYFLEKAPIDKANKLKELLEEVNTFANEVRKFSDCASERVTHLLNFMFSGR